MTAALNRDADKAAALLTEHFGRTAELVKTVVHEAGD